MLGKISNSRKVILSSEIEGERFHLYNSEMLRNYIGSIITGLPIYYFIFQPMTSRAANIWFALDALLAITVSLSYYPLHKAKDKFTLRSRKIISYIPLITFSAILSVAPWLFLHDSADIYLFTMIIMIAALTGTIAYAISYYIQRQVVFMTLPFISLLAKLYSMNDSSIIIYGILIFLWLSSFLFSYRINKSLINAITLKFEHLQARADAERLSEEKSRFIAAASHDIRQPFQAINLFVNSLKTKNTNAEDALLLERLQKSVDNASELLNGLLDISKLDAGTITAKPKHIDIASIVKKLEHEALALAASKNITLNLTIQEEAVFADPLLLEQVLSNLLSNAIRYTHSGTVTLDYQRQSEHLIVSVSDTGIGIADKDKDAIFNEFYQVDAPAQLPQRGLGLGLSISKRLCDLQDWKLSVDSVLDAGSQFSISLPVGKKSLIRETKSINISRSFDGIRVLILDDDESIRYSLAKTLTGWGCDVLSFSSSAEACISLKNHS